jgi:hypothetical protein
MHFLYLLHFCTYESDDTAKIDWLAASLAVTFLLCTGKGSALHVSSAAEGLLATERRPSVIDNLISPRNYSSDRCNSPPGNDNYYWNYCDNSSQYVSSAEIINKL